MFDRYEFEWDADNVEHIARHEVECWEAEEAVADGNRVSFSAHGKDRAGAIGVTQDGRVLVVIVEQTKRRVGTVRRVVTARDAAEGEKRAYRRRNR